MRRYRYVIFSIAVIIAALSASILSEPNETYEGSLSPMNIDGPTATLSVPYESGLCSACSSQGFTITFSPSETVLGSTITFEVNGIAYSTADSDVVTFEAYSGNLVFNPTAPWPDGTIVHVDSVCACDIHNNWSINALEFTYHIDLSPPVVSDLTPPDGEIVPNLQPTISFVVSDSGCGVDPSSIRFNINGTNLTISSTGAYFSNDTVYFYTDEYGMIFSDGEAVDICVTGAADEPAYCPPNQLDSDVCWSCTVYVSGPTVEVISPLPNEWIACDSGEQEIIISLTDSNGIADTTINLIVDGESFEIADDELTYSSIDDELRFVPSVPWEDGDTIEVILYSAEDTLGHGLAFRPRYAFYVDLSPPETTFVYPEDGVAIHPGPAYVAVGITDKGAGLIDSTLGISIDGVWHDYGALGVIWDAIGESLVYDGLATGDTFFAGEIIEVCVRGDDTTTLCGPNHMDMCWQYTTTAHGPFAEPIKPVPWSVTSCAPSVPGTSEAFLDSLVQIRFYDTDGDPISMSSIWVSINGVSLAGYPVVNHYEESESTLYIWVGPRDHGDTIHLVLREAEDIYHSPLAETLVIRFAIDTIGPEIIGAYPPEGGLIPPGTPDLWFACKDFPAGLDHSVGRIDFGSYSYFVGSGPFFTLSGDTLDTLRLPGAVYGADTVLENGDNICLTITLSDSAQYCGENESVTEWCFNVGATPPIATIVSPSDSAITSCPAGNMKIIISDEDGLEYDSVGVVVNETRYYAAIDPEIIIRGDTVIFNAVEPFEHGDTVTFWAFAQDIHGTPLMAVDTSTFIIDLMPPETSGMYPVPGTATLDWEASISLNLLDVPGGIFDSMTMTITTPRWVRTFAPGSTATTWSLSTFKLDVPAYNFGGGWEPLLDDVLIFWHERETVEVAVYAADLACCCGPNDSTYEWKFSILDDDTIGPQFADISPAMVFDGIPVNISATITDPSGIYDDGTGPEGQGVYVLWDSDGSLSNGGEMATQMSLFVGNIFTTDSNIGPFSMADVPVFCIIARDDDYDFLDTVDRAISISDTIRPVLNEGKGPTAELVYPAPNSYTSCDSDSVVIELTDPDGIAESSIVLVANSRTFTVGDGLFYSNDSLVWWPDVRFADGQQVAIELTAAEDTLDYDLDSTYLWTFYVDTSPPDIQLYQFREIIPPDDDPTVTWRISDYGAGIDDTLIEICVGEDVLDVSDFGVYFGGTYLDFDAEAAGYSLDSTLTVCIGACDLARYCGANCAETLCVTYRRSKDTECDIWPIPFTPNSDNVNEVVWFEYPDMEIEGATVEVFDIEGKRVFSAQFPPTSPESRAFWNGIRDNNKKAIPGTYAYVITRGGKVLCSGILTLVR